MMSRIHLSLPNAYKLMCFDKNINGNGDDKFFEWDYWSLHWPRKLTLVSTEKSSGFRWKKASLGVRSPCLQHYSQNPNHRWMGERKGRRKLSYFYFILYWNTVRKFFHFIRKWEWRNLTHSELKYSISFWNWFWRLIVANRPIVLNFYQKMPVFF